MKSSEFFQLLGNQAQLGVFGSPIAVLTSHFVLFLCFRSENF